MDLRAFAAFLFDSGRSCGNMLTTVCFPWVQIFETIHAKEHHDCPSIVRLHF